MLGTLFPALLMLAMTLLAGFSKAFAGGPQDLSARWQIARSEYRQAYSSLPALVCHRETTTTVTDSRIIVEDPSERQAATIWSESDRCAISEQVTFRSGTIVSQWRGFDGKGFAIWSQTQVPLSGGIKAPGAHIAPRGWGPGRIQREWTIRRLLGQ